ncbi:hypothetical protein [Aquimarina sp. 2201CG14-23]|uniref:hypothetical protein n=1 Tax=Aquimarina mycalae TaxID=3040073 RepID=UPI00247809F3|nr:hypothetical protein [Aquimarina sp. 2201CG14-23]MDH7447523.1 hypothetical protein [Aquimarina sp. 2201CG14-23]
MKKQLLSIAIFTTTISTLLAQNDQDVQTKDQVFADDLIVQGSMQVGTDATNGYNFGFDTFVMAENNLRMYFDDTSNSASFAQNDWRFTFNETTNGGANYFSVDDATANTVPFRIDAGAGNNAMRIEAGGNVGIGTADPAVKFQITDGNSPVLRLEQDGSDGFTAQSWDLAGNEANFFIRDVTNGSKLPFRIQPNTPENTLSLRSNGAIGVGTNGPNGNASIHLASTTKGLLINRMTTAQRTTFEGNLSAGLNGMMVFDSEENELYVWNGTAWVSTISASVLSDLETRVAALETVTAASGTDQTPQIFNYQSVIRDNTGSILTNQNIGFQISILQGSNAGASVYTETHSITTSDNGVATFMVGNGALVSGDFTTIDWGSNTHFVQIEADITGGTTYQLVGTSQLISVPYAIHARSADYLSGTSAKSLLKSSDDKTKRIQSLEAEVKELKIMVQQLMSGKQ